MKLCILGNPNSIHVRRWAIHFTRRGDSVYWIGEHVPSFPEPEGIKFIDLTQTVNIRKFRYLAWSIRVHKLVHRLKPDILHAHGLASAGWLAAAAGYKPTLVTAHGSDLMLLDKRSLAHQALTRWVLRRADYVTCVSAQLAQKAAALGVTADRLQILFLGVDTEVFRPPRNIGQVRSELGLSDGIYIASIRALSPLYHPEVIAQTIQNVLEQISQSHFLIFSYNADPGILQHFQERFAGYINTGRIRLVENLTDDLAISKYYQAADIAISVPDSDGTPKSVQEAMASERAVIASDIPAIHEWIRSEETGLLVPVQDPQALTNAILRIVADPALKVRLGAAARQEILARADSRQCMEKYQLLYEQLASGQRVS